MTAKAPECPSCHEPVPQAPENRCFPFCSQRCRTIDLGRWLNGEYRIAVSHEGEDDGREPAAGPQRDGA